MEDFKNQMNYIYCQTTSIHSESLALSEYHDMHLSTYEKQLVWLNLATIELHKCGACSYIKKIIAFDSKVNACGILPH